MSSPAPSASPSPSTAAAPSISPPPPVPPPLPPPSSSSSPPSTSPSTGLPGLPFPSPPLSVHPLHSQSPQIPLRLLIASFTQRTHNHLHDLLEQLDSEKDADDRARRTQIFQFFHSTQLALTRLHVLTRFLHQHEEELDRLGALNEALQQRKFLFQSSVDVLKVAGRHVESSLLPPHDAATAIHVLSTGDYQQLPRLIERVLDDKQRMDEAAISRVQQRLNSALHVRLLTSELPPDLTGVEVEGGVARLLSPACVMSVSLRMMPKGEVEMSEESRIKWRLFAIEWRLRGEGEGEAVLVSDTHTAHLISHCNALMHSSPSPLLTLHRTLHSFITSLLLSLLHHQAVGMQSHYKAQAIALTHIPSQSLAITYWKEAQVIPHEGAIANTSSSSSPFLSPTPSSLTITAHQHRLQVTHSPPLPELEGVDSLSSASSSLFAIDPQSVSLPRLFARILAAHARHRIDQLRAFLEREMEEGAGPRYDRMRVERQDEEEDEDEKSMKGEEGEAEDDSATDRFLLRRHVLALSLVPGWTLHARVDQQRGRFIFSWAHRLQPQLPSSRAVGNSLVAPLSSLLSLSSLPSALQSLRVEARLSHLEESLASLHLGVRMQRSPLLLWSPALPSPVDTSDGSSLLYIRLVTSPLFFLLVHCPVEVEEVEAVSLYFLQCDFLDSPAPVATQVSGGAAQKKSHPQCLVMTPIACQQLLHPSLSSSSLLSSSSSSALSSRRLTSSPLSSLVSSALLSCEERVPLSIFLHQLRRLSHTSLQRLSTTSASFAVAYAQSKGDNSARVTVTIEWSPTYAVATSASSSSAAAAFAAAASTSSVLMDETDPSSVRCGWTAAVEHPQLTRVYSAVLERARTRSTPSFETLAAGLAALSASSPPTLLSSSGSPAVILLHFRSLAPSSISAFSDQLHHLHLCSYLEGQTSMLSLTQAKWSSQEAAQPGDLPPPNFFTSISCSATAVVLQYNLRHIPYFDQPDDVCTLTLRCRRNDLEPHHYLGRGRPFAFTLHTTPYIFPHHTFLEWEFNHRLDLITLLKHVYWSCSAVKVIHSFLDRVSAHDRAAGYHHLHFHQQVTMSMDGSAVSAPSTAPSNAPSAAAPTSPAVILLAFAPTLHSVTVLPQSSTRLRFIFRKQPRTTKADLRLLNGYAFVQDFLASDGRGREEKQPPGRVPIQGLESYLLSWYQFCGQHEQWRRVSKWNHTAFTVPVSFDRLPLNAKPTAASLITIRLADTSGLTAAEGESLCRFFKEWVCVPPYSAECMHSFLSLCSAPMPVISAMMQVITLQLQTHSSTRKADSSSSSSPLAVRWFHHLNAPFDLHYDAQFDVAFFVLQLSSLTRGDAVYIPIAFCLSNGCVGWWQMEEESRQSEDKSQPVIHRSYRTVRRPGGSGDGAADATASPGPHLLEKWKGLGALVEALMSFDLDGLIGRLAQLSPPLSVEQWCSAVGEVQVDGKAEQAGDSNETTTPHRMEITV